MSEKVKIPPYNGWRPRKAKGGHGGGSTDREAKRTKLGNSKQRAIYKSAHGYKSPEYSMLCARADALNKRDKKAE
jgi:hypothetical protein